MRFRIKSSCLAVRIIAVATSQTNPTFLACVKTALEVLNNEVDALQTVLRRTHDTSEVDRRTFQPQAISSPSREGSEEFQDATFQALRDLIMTFEKTCVLHRDLVAEYRAHHYHATNNPEDAKKIRATLRTELNILQFCVSRLKSTFTDPSTYLRTSLSAHQSRDDLVDILGSSLDTFNDRNFTNPRIASVDQLRGCIVSNEAKSIFNDLQDLLTEGLGIMAEADTVRATNAELIRKIEAVCLLIHYPIAYNNISSGGALASCYDGRT